MPPHTLVPVFLSLSAALSSVRITLAERTVELCAYITIIPASEQILNDLGMPIPWRLSGSPSESKVSKTEPLNQIRRPSTYWLEFLLTTMLLPFLAALAFIRVAFRLDLAHYFSKYEEPVKSLKVQ